MTTVTGPAHCGLTDFTHHYLWCCHAIQWGIAQYDAHRAVQPLVGTS